ncbi:MAG: phosphoglycerate kinase [Chlamydiales bacterium]|jgi:phosphoglycerate kinase
MLSKLSIRELPINNKRVLVRVDFNVPMDDNGEISDDTRIQASLPTIKYILSHGGSVILMSHLGRPKGKVNDKFSLAPCAIRLSQLLGKKVIMAPDVIGPKVKSLTDKLQPGEIILLENLRFYPAEENPGIDPDFVLQLASLGNLYVNDAFGTAHREHSSTVKITSCFPDSSAAGFLVEKELSYLGENLLNPKRPFYALIGGAKVSSKLGVIHSLIKNVDGLVVFGGMAFTFLKALGMPIGKSLCEDSFLDKAKEILKTCEENGVQLLLPCDFLSADRLDDDAVCSLVDDSTGIAPDEMGLDIGPRSIEMAKEFIGDANTILWNGPAGVFEISKFSKGTLEIANFLAKSSASTIVGGGDSIAALNSSGLSGQINHISTGGGASLEYIEFGTLPGIEALSASPNSESLRS